MVWLMRTRRRRETKHGLTVWVDDWSHSLKFVLTTCLFEVISANVSIFDPSSDRIECITHLSPPRRDNLFISPCFF